MQHVDFSVFFISHMKCEKVILKYQYYFSHNIVPFIKNMNACYLTTEDIEAVVG